MNRTRLFFTLGFILFGLAARVPAPIVEESQPPAPKTKRVEQKRSPEPAGSAKQSTFAAFVGVWLGNVTVSVNSDTAALNKTSTKPGGFIISNDGTVKWGPNGQDHAKGLLSSDNRELHWTYQNFDEHGNVRWSCSLRLADSKTANYHGDGSVTSAFASGTMKSSGTLTKQ